MSIFEELAEHERLAREEAARDRREPVVVEGVARPGDGSPVAQAWAAFRRPPGLDQGEDPEREMVAAIEAAGLVPDLPLCFGPPPSRGPDPAWVVALRTRTRQSGRSSPWLACGVDGVGARARLSRALQGDHDWLEVWPYDRVAQGEALSALLFTRQRLLEARQLPLDEDQLAAAQAEWRERLSSALLILWKRVLEDPASLERWQAFAQAVAVDETPYPTPDAALSRVLTKEQAAVLRQLERERDFAGSTESGYWGTFSVGGQRAAAAYIFRMNLPEVLRKLFDKLGRKELKDWLPRGKAFPAALRVPVTGAFACLDPLEGARALVARAGGTLRVEGERFVIEV